MLEIDGVQRALEAPCTEAGDYLSDEYFRIIDHSTSPVRDSWLNHEHIASAIRRLNRNLGTTAVHLEHAGLAEVYNDVATQLNEMNRDVGELELIEPASAQNLVYSGFFNWG